MIVLFDIDYTLFDTAAFKESGLTNYSLYPGVKKILEQLSSSFTLGILSQGETDFQLKKLDTTGIRDVFDRDHMFIIPDKKEALAEILGKIASEEIVFVEDKLEMLEEAKRVNPKIKTVWYRNGPFAENTKSTFNPDVIIFELSKLLEVLK